MSEYTLGRDKQNIFDPHEITFDLAGATLDKPLSLADHKKDPETYFYKLENVKLLIYNKSVEEINAMIGKEIHRTVLDRLFKEELDSGEESLIEKLRRVFELNDSN